MGRKNEQDAFYEDRFSTEMKLLRKIKKLKTEMVEKTEELEEVKKQITEREEQLLELKEVAQDMERLRQERDAIVDAAMADIRKNTERHDKNIKALTVHLDQLFGLIKQRR